MIRVRVRWVVGAGLGCLVRGVGVGGTETYVVYGYGDSRLLVSTRASFLTSVVMCLRWSLKS
jgi:hypothetical protein